MSNDQSPPRKRVRSLRTNSALSRQTATRSTPSTMIDDDVCSTSIEKELLTPSGPQHKKPNTRKMRMQNKKHRQRGPNNGAMPPEGSEGFLGDVTPTTGNLSEDENDISDEEESCLATSIIRKVKRRNHLSSTDQEIVRLIGQHLTNIGLKTTANVLMQEAGCKLDQPTAATFKKLVLEGEWSQAVKTLDELRHHLESPDHVVEMKFLLFEQKYLEHLARGNSIEALKVLQTEITPLKHKQNRTHELSSYLMYSDPEDIARITSSAHHQNGALGACGSSSKNENNPRFQLMERLQTYLPAAIMMPPRRLATLLTQAANYQTDRCLYHNVRCGSPILDTTYLAVDHVCSKQDFPCETIQVLTDHCEEVWYCRFSPNGLKLATGSKDHTVIVWDFNPETLKFKLSKTLERHTPGMAYFAWSPDSTKLAVCGPEDCDEVWVWNVDSGVVDFKISHSSEDSITSVSWSPDGRKIACGGPRGQFYQCDTKGTVLDSWEGIRVQCLAYRKDGKSVLAADTHHRLRSYNFEELSDTTILQETHGIMTFTLDESDRYALVMFAPNDKDKLNVATQGIHLWDIQEKCLIRKFVGVTQGFYTIYSCFGGTGQKYVASGSEDTKVYIYHIKREEPIAELVGHSRTVNCVAWNPVYPRVMVSTSDDCTIRVWGPSEKYRNIPSSDHETSTSNNHHSHQNGKDFHGGAGNNFSNGVM